MEGRRSHRRRPGRQRRRRAASARVVAAPAAKSAAPGSAPAPILVPDFRVQHHQLFRPGFDLTVDGAEAAEPAADAELVDEPVFAGEELQLLLHLQLHMHNFSFELHLCQTSYGE